MTEYEDDFERDEDQEKKHMLKLSIDVLSVKDMQLSANIVVSY
jgi:hypothetical protein